MSAPRRITITSPRATAARQRRRGVTQEIDDQTGVGDAFMRSLIRTQLRLALLVLGTLGAGVCTLPLLFAWVPGARAATIGGIPLPWVVLGAGVYPLLVALGWFYLRQAERIEREFSAVVKTTERE